MAVFADGFADVRLGVGRAMNLAEFIRRLKAIYDDRNAGMGALADLLSRSGFTTGWRHKMLMVEGDGMTPPSACFHWPERARNGDYVKS